MLALTLTLALAGCGISATGTTDEGDGLATGTGLTDTDVLSPPPPDTAALPEDAVRYYLAAASGGLAQVKAFLTENGLKSFKDPANKDNPALTIVHMIGDPTAGPLTNGRIPVTVTYRVVGTLTDQGRVDELAELNQQQMTFQVLPDKQKPSLRIDEVAGAPDGLMLSDLALSQYYRIQPIYFWDSPDPATSVLVPDLRYLPLTITSELRSQRVVQYLAAGSSPWLAGLQRLPVGATPSDFVTSQNGTLVVKFTAEAAAAGEAGLKRLLYQLQWSLSTPNRTPTIALQIDDKIVDIHVGANDFVPYNLSSTFNNPAQRYDVTAEAKVVAVPAGPNPQGVLASPANQNVTSAAISRRGDVAAYVRNVAGTRSLTIVHASGQPVESSLRGSNMGRPAFTSSNGDVLVPVNGRLYAVNGTDGTFTEVLKNVSGVSAVSVSPDARRVRSSRAIRCTSPRFPLVASVQPRPILSGQFAATSVAWTSETWLMVSGAVRSVARHRRRRGRRRPVQQVARPDLQRPAGLSAMAGPRQQQPRRDRARGGPWFVLVPRSSCSRSRTTRPSSAPEPGRGGGAAAVRGLLVAWSFWPRWSTWCCRPAVAAAARRPGRACAPAAHRCWRNHPRPRGPRRPRPGCPRAWPARSTTARCGSSSSATRSADGAT